MTSAAAPLVSVIVIAYNDAANLPAALASVTTQTLRDLEVIVVDDASTDGTAEVAERVAAADSRVRVVRLDVNSGGCSRPRNAGLAVATGRYVMFLDSDDTYTRRACRKLVTVALATGADVVSGRLVRRVVAERRDVGWQDWLYDRRSFVDGILDRRELLYDTTCTNKLYRREFLVSNGIRFPEGIHYEDLLFTTEVYCTARGIATIPDTVYVWNVVRDSDRPSISNRRLLLANWADRIEAHRRIDAFLTEHDVGRELRATKDTKFLDHDLRLLFTDVQRYAEPARTELVTMVGSYVAGLDPQARATARLDRRVGAYLVEASDTARTLSVAEYAASGQLDTDLAGVGNRVYWTDAYLDRPGGRAALDVTELGFDRAPLSQLPLTAVADAIEPRDGELVVRGHVPDLLGRLEAIRDDVRLSGAVVSRNTGWRLPAAVTAEPYADGRIAFEAAYPMAGIGERLTLRDRRIRLLIVVAAGEERRDVGIVTRELPLDALSFPVIGRLAPIVGDRLVPRDVDGTLGFVLRGRHRLLDDVMLAGRRVRDSRPVRRARRVARGRPRRVG
jgi:CDP-glycerol glycerophosphotransferase